MRAIHSLEDIFVQSCLCCMYWFMGAMARRPTNGRASHSFHTHLCSWPTQTHHIFFYYRWERNLCTGSSGWSAFVALIDYYYYHDLEPTKVLFWLSQEVHLRFSLAISFALLLHSTSSHDTTIELVNLCQQNTLRTTQYYYFQRPEMTSIFGHSK